MESKKLKNTLSEGSPLRVGIIGGTGIDRDTGFFKELKYVDVQPTPFGSTSDDRVITGVISKTEVVLMSRHGKDHNVNPSNVNYRANFWALKNQFNVHVILATTACGSLRNDIPPGTLVALDQYIDRTKRGDLSCFKVSHVPQGEPFDQLARDCLLKALSKSGYDYRKSGTAVTIEGPRFSTRAESKLFQSWSADIVNMTTVPECSIARELGMHYCSLALVTDFDCWHESEKECVSVSLVGNRLPELREKAHKVLVETIAEIEARDWSEHHANLVQSANDAIMAW